MTVIILISQIISGLLSGTEANAKGKILDYDTLGV